MTEAVKNAIETLKQAVSTDPDYAWSWHCNIATAAVDAGCPHQVANYGAARFMVLLFGVDTRNHPGFPKSERPAYLQRVVEEKAALDEKLDKLEAFFKTDTFKVLDVDEIGRLFGQAAHMRSYSNILGERIAAFG